MARHPVPRLKQHTVRVEAPARFGCACRTGRGVYVRALTSALPAPSPHAWYGSGSPMERYIALRSAASLGSCR